MSEVSLAPRKVRTFLKVWHHVEVWVAVLAFSAIALLLIYDVILREALMPDVDAAVNALLRKAGYGDNLLHRTGHGFGVTGHEGPFLAEGDMREIRPGMVFSIEPGIYLPEVGGFRHSDTVLITETGNHNMTPYAETLEELTLPV